MSSPGCGLRDESLEDTSNLSPPHVLAQEIADDLEAALAEFTQIAESLRPPEVGGVGVNGFMA